MSKTSKLANFGAMQDAMASNKVIIITHPKKQGRAEIIVKYPKDGAGRLQAWCADYFGANGCEGVQYATAGGYGYDKLTAALSDFTIDGHALSDHCSRDATSAKLLKAYRAAYAHGGNDAGKKIEARATKAGYSFTNWADGGWGSCYKLSGTDYLLALGYNVLTVG